MGVNQSPLLLMQQVLEAKVLGSKARKAEQFVSRFLEIINN